MRDVRSRFTFHAVVLEAQMTRSTRFPRFRTTSASVLLAALALAQGAALSGVLALPVRAVSVAPPAFAGSAFEATWRRTDAPVASGGVKRSWFWGPAPDTAGLMEEYKQGAGGKRLVQYFDKSRMEI